MYEGYLIHYNPNHDKKTGRFTFSTGKDLYKSIKRDVITGKFDPKNYKNNESVNKAVKDNNVVALKKKAESMRKDYEQKESEVKLYNKLSNRYLEKQRAIEEKYYKEMLKPNMTEDEKLNIRDIALEKASLDMLKDKRYNNWDAMIDYSKMSKNITFNDTTKANMAAALAYDKAVDKIIGEYSNKSIKTFDDNTKARIYVGQIINEIIKEE